jgi:pilus assembly protein CpaF
MNELLEKIYDHTELADLDPAERRLALRSIVSSSVGERELPLVLSEIADAIDGFGPLTQFMRSEDVTDVLVNGSDEIWVERSGALERVEGRFDGDDELMSFIERVAGAAGARVDASHPIADARLADGSRVHIVLPPIAPLGPLVSIRRWPRMPYSIDDLVLQNMLTPADRQTLHAAVKDRRTIAVSGATGTGKTTLLNALLGCIGSEERIVTIEETPELRPPCLHSVSMLSRQPNIEGKGAVTLADLVRAALRMRPDRIVIGEVRGAEVLAALSALSTGHAGSMLTVHARSASHAIDRLVSLALSASTAETESSLRFRVRESFDLLVHVDRSRGCRGVAEIVSVNDLAV